MLKNINSYFENSDITKSYQIESYGYYHSFLKFAYEYLNGEVNTNIRSLNLIIHSLNNTVIGYCHSFIISINLPMIYNNSIINHFSDKEIKGTIVFILIHELSHCDQNINILRLSRDKEYRRNIEYVNNLNTIRFINDNFYKLFNVFGELYIPKSILSEFFNQKQYFKNRPYFKYEQAISIKNQFLMVLEGWTQIRIRDYLENPRINITNFDITFKFLSSQPNKEDNYNFHIISNDIFVLSNPLLRSLSKLLTIAVFEYNKPEIYLGNNNTYLNIVVRIITIPQINPVEFVE